MHLEYTSQFLVETFGSSASNVQSATDWIATNVSVSECSTGSQSERTQTQTKRLSVCLQTDRTVKLLLAESRWKRLPSEEDSSDNKTLIKPKQMA